MTWASATFGISPAGFPIPSRALNRIASSRHVLLVAEREDIVTWKSLRNVPTVHMIAPDQLNTYDVLVSDDVIFTEGALAAFLTGDKQLGEAVEVLAQEPADRPAPIKQSAPEPAPAAAEAVASDSGDDDDDNELGGEA